MEFLEALETLDATLFLTINGLSDAGWADAFMLFCSKKPVWIPLYLFLGYLFYNRFGAKNMIWVLLGAGVLVMITDRGSVLFFKDVFQRFRPCHNANLVDQVNLVAGKCGGQFGFISSHAANVFGLASFVGGLFRWSKHTFWVFLWAAVVSFSRIYLGVHYPFDVLVGAFYGLLVGIIVSKILLRSFKQ